MPNLRPIDGFWLPRDIRLRLLPSSVEYQALSFTQGRPCQADDEGAITAHWPRLSMAQWRDLLAALGANRSRLPTGHVLWERLQAALLVAGRRFADESDPLRRQALETVPRYTGYSEPMIRLALGALEMFSLEGMEAAFSHLPMRAAVSAWQRMPGLPGRLRFFPQHAWQRSLYGAPGLRQRPLFDRQEAPALVVGYGAGNVPGAALLISLLSQSIALLGSPMPAILVKNSRREPLFCPLVLTALEEADPELVCSLAVLVWDYEEADIQDFLLAQASLVMVAASDETITQVDGQVRRAAQKAAGPQPPRFHAHGHKVSFSAISKEMLQPGRAVDGSYPLIDAIALLAALDSVFWDQHGCLSARLHFVEEGGAGYATALDYASRLVTQLRGLAAWLPRGAWPRQQIHDRFDRYKGLELSGQVWVLSDYDDEFLVTVDRRPLDAAAFRSQVNDCQGRVIVVRPVADLMEIPERFLSLIPPSNLQSLSVAVGHEGEGLTEGFLRFASACAECGVTAVRTLGRGAFPQLAYSWDGLIPLDLAYRRPGGYFTTIEFDHPFAQILDTYRLMRPFS
jgi:hypothetical protein